MEKLVVSALEQLGFSASDAKVYVGLLQGHPATGYELAKRTRVPRSAMYAVLGRLERAGVLRAVQANPAKYEPLPPQQLVSMLRDQHQQTLEDLQQALERMDRSPRTSSLWATVGYGPILGEAERLIRSSQKLVAASLWAREANRLAPALEDARRRGVEVVLFSFTPLPEIGPVIGDRKRMLVGSAEDDTSRATFTDEPDLIEMALSTLVLDLTLLGQRLERDTASSVELLTEHLAPVDQLLKNSRAP